MFPQTLRCEVFFEYATIHHVSYKTVCRLFPYLVACNFSRLLYIMYLVTWYNLAAPLVILYVYLELRLGNFCVFAAKKTPLDTA